MPPLNAEPAPPNDRRVHPRKRYQIDCKVAPYKPGAGLMELTFQTMKLYDLSAGGFSFWTSQWPQYAELAVMLTDPEAGVILAHVRKVQHIRGRYIVRCQFVRDLSAEPN